MLKQTGKSRHLTRWGTRLLLFLGMIMITMFVLVGSADYDVSQISFAWQLKHIMMIIVLGIISAIILHIVKEYGNTEVISEITEDLNDKIKD